MKTADLFIEILRKYDVQNSSFQEREEDKHFDFLRQLLNIGSNDYSEDLVLEFIDELAQLIVINDADDLAYMLVDSCPKLSAELEEINFLFQGLKNLERESLREELKNIDTEQADDEKYLSQALINEERGRLRSLMQDMDEMAAASANSGQFFQKASSRQSRQRPAIRWTAALRIAALFILLLAPVYFFWNLNNESASNLASHESTDIEGPIDSDATQNTSDKIPTIENDHESSVGETDNINNIKPIEFYSHPINYGNDFGYASVTDSLMIGFEQNTNSSVDPSVIRYSLIRQDSMYQLTFYQEKIDLKIYGLDCIAGVEDNFMNGEGVLTDEFSSIVFVVTIDGQFYALKPTSRKTEMKKIDARLLCD
jgi:hypothetical protein